ncbi:MAG: trigger factor [Gemmatimonadetes bacterium]|nr:trigger factor [Gemmatimonadota bacterium]
MDITITPTDSTGVSRRLQVSVPADAVASFEEQAARKYAARVRIPGFRPGMAPPSMVRKRFGEAVRAEAVELAINEAFRLVVDRQGLKLAAQPHLHHLKAEPGAAVEFEMHCEVRPEPALDQVTGFSLARQEAPVGEAEVEAQLERIREQKAEWTPVEEKPLPGDMVTVLLASAEPDGSLPEGREYRLVLGGGQAIAGVEELVMQALPGGTVEAPVRWPDDFPDEAQRGVTKLVRVELKDVKRKSLPPLDDALARELGDFDSVAAMRETVARDMAEHARREADAEVRQQLLERLLEANPFDVPGAWVAQVLESYLRMYRIPEGEKARFAEEFRPMAERQVKRDVLVDVLAEREGLAASAADVDARIESMAAARNTDPGQLYAQWQKAGRLEQLERELTEERVFAWLLERNPVTAA